MSLRYNSSALGVWFAVLAFLLLTFIVLICVGLTKVLSPALGVSELPVLTGLVIFVFGYMMFGGANTMIYTNAVQAVLMLIVAVMMLASGWQYFDHGVSGFWQQLAAVDPKLILPFNSGSPLFRDWFEVIFCNLFVGVAIVCQPHIITRSLMLKRAEDVNRYLWIAIVVETVFFMVLFTGFYARLQFPDLTMNGTPLKMDAIIPAYVLQVFPVGAGILVILGLISAGLSTLEGLIQSVSTTLTNDLLTRFTGSRVQNEEQHTRFVARMNKTVIGVMAVITIAWSYYQLQYPGLSVGILAQNGVYAYFSAAFVPVLLGIYGKDVPIAAPASASVTAIAVHFGVYYGGLTPYTQGAVRNPAVAAALAILSATIVGLSIYQLRKKKGGRAGLIRFCLPVISIQQLFVNQYFISK